MKIYQVLMCAAGITMLAACGDKKSAATSDEMSASEAVAAADKATEAMSGVDKCAATLEKGWGIQLKQIEPSFAFEEVTEGWDKFIGNGVNSATAVYKKKDGSAISKEEFRAWAEQLFALTKKLSTDGKNIRGYDGISKLTEEQANAEVTLDDCMIDDNFPSWSFRTDKGLQRCHASLEEKDPNYVSVGFAPGLTGNLE